jgi:hypothetical protein
VTGNRRIAWLPFLLPYINLECLLGSEVVEIGKVGTHFSVAQPVAGYKTKSQNVPQDSPENILILDSPFYV